jgi:hypothetical protein
MTQSAVGSRVMTGCFLALALLGCGGGDGDPGVVQGEVTGAWCGREVSSPEECTGDEVEYLELKQQGDQVTGIICEAFQQDCAPIEDGLLQGAKLTFGFDPQDVGGLATLTLNGDILDGDLYSGKCACHLPYTFHRI